MEFSFEAYSWLFSETQDICIKLIRKNTRDAELNILRCFILRLNQQQSMYFSLGSVFKKWKWETAVEIQNGTSTTFVFLV